MARNAAGSSGPFAAAAPKGRGSRGALCAVTGFDHTPPAKAATVSANKKTRANSAESQAGRATSTRCLVFAKNTARTLTLRFETLHRTRCTLGGDGRVRNSQEREKRSIRPSPWLAGGFAGRLVQGGCLPAGKGRVTSACFLALGGQKGMIRSDR